jgi:hypothetical protein
MKFQNTILGLFLALSIPSTSTAHDTYYTPYPMAACLGMFSPAFTPSPELAALLETSIRPRRLEVIAQARMRDAVNMHRAEQCVAMKQGDEPEPCPAGTSILIDPFLASVIEEFAGADVATIEAGLRAEIGGPSKTNVLEICKK